MVGEVCMVWMSCFGWDADDLLQACEISGRGDLDG